MEALKKSMQSDEQRFGLECDLDHHMIVASRYDKARAEAILGNGLADLVAFGCPFIANPDFPERMRRDLSLAGFDGATLFGGSEQSYTDYPAYPAS